MVIDDARRSKPCVSVPARVLIGNFQAATPTTTRRCHNCQCARELIGIGGNFIVREPRHQIAICYLLLKGEHWIPVSPERRLTTRDRSSPDGPVIMAEVIAEVEDNRVSGWRKVGSLIQGVGPDGKVEPLDTRLPGAIIGALLSDGAASERGVVGINSRIVERRRAREEWTIPPHLYAAVLARAETQILDRLNGFNAVGIRLIPVPSDESSG